MEKPANAGEILNLFDADRSDVSPEQHCGSESGNADEESKPQPPA
jgi:hypothetical protein